MTEYPKIHVNITPSAYIAVKDKISEVLQLKAQGPINNSPYNFQRSVWRRNQFDNNDKNDNNDNDNNDNNKSITTVVILIFFIISNFVYFYNGKRSPAGIIKNHIKCWPVNVRSFWSSFDEHPYDVHFIIAVVAGLPQFPPLRKKLCLRAWIRPFLPPIIFLEKIFSLTNRRKFLAFAILDDHRVIVLSS